MKKWRSRVTTDGLDRAPHRAFMRAMGLDDEALAGRLDDLAVVGRAQPSMKARIVRVLQARGRYVGMIGDGVNDIPAIKTANVGVAMGSGTSASRAVADIVLLNDRFALVPQAVAEGRRIVNGMVGAASLLLTRTLYMLLIVLAATLAGFDFPFSPRNNSLLALVTVGVPSLVVLGWATATEAAECKTGATETGGSDALRAAPASLRLRRPRGGYRRRSARSRLAAQQVDLVAHRLRLDARRARCVP